MGFKYRKRPVKAKIDVVTGTRAIDGTIYQNTTGRPMLIIVMSNHVRGDVLAANAYCTSHVGNVTPPVVAMATEGLNTMDNQPDDTYGILIIAVPNGWYYKVTGFISGVGSSNTLGFWAEVEL